MTSKPVSSNGVRINVSIVRLILEKGFSIEVESEAEGFVITNKQPYDKKLRKHKKMKVHLKVKLGVE